MKKTFAIFIVCLLLTTFGGSAAMAESEETVITVTCTPGAAFADTAELNQLMDIAALRIHAMPDGYGALVLTLEDIDAISALLHYEEDGIYVQSQMLGKSPFYFSFEDLETMLMEQMDMPAEFFTNMEKFNEMFEMILDGSMTEEQMFSMLGADEETLNYIANYNDSQIVETGAFTLNGSDIANQKIVTVTDSEDMIDIYNLPFVRQMLVSIVQIDGSYTSQEEIDAAVDDIVAEITQENENNDYICTQTVYMNDDEFVAMSMETNGTMNDDAYATAIEITKTTVDQAAFYQFTYHNDASDGTTMNQYASLYESDEFIFGKLLLNSYDEEPVIQVTLSCDRSEADHTSGEFAMTYYDTYTYEAQSMLAMFDQVRGENTSDTTIDLFASKGTVDDLKADLANSSLLSFNIGIVIQPDSGFFADLQAATPESSVQLLQMTEEEMTAYTDAMQQSMMVTFMTVIQSLPPDIIDSLQQSMGGSF